MQWQDEGFIVRSLAFHERALRLFIFTRHHGLTHGIHPFARHQRTLGHYQRGNVLQVTWQARLEDHVGQWRSELLTPFGGFAIQFPSAKLQAFESCLALLAQLLPERMPLTDLYNDSRQLLGYWAHDADDDWLVAYCRFEYGLLARLGYGFNLDNGQEVILLSHGRGEGLAPAMARGEPFLPLPAFLWRDDTPTPSQEEQRQALQLCGYFLEKIFISLKKLHLPTPRQQLVQWLMRAIASTNGEAKIPSANG